jgi:hypothetical protein
MNYHILNLSERNFASEMICGQANDVAKQANQIQTVGGVPRIVKKDVAIERARLVGLKATDGKVYPASAEAGPGQIMAIGWSFSEVAQLQAMDVMKAELEIDLGAAVAGAAPNKLAYLSPSAPGEVTATKPSTEGQLIQIVGVFINDHVVKYDVKLSDSLVAGA